MVTRLAAAFTLIELLVVVAVISVLLALLMPSLSHVKELAKQNGCMGNVRQLGVLAASYSNDSDGFIPSCFNSSTTSASYDFQDRLAALYSIPKSTYSAADSGNAIARSKARNIFHCPSVDDDVYINDTYNRFTSYGVNDLAIHNGGGSAARNIKYGMFPKNASTMLFIENYGHNSADYSQKTLPPTIISAFAHRHLQTNANAVFMDMHVKSCINKQTPGAINYPGISSLTLKNTYFNIGIPTTSSTFLDL